jgi:hypothetical protein
MVFVLRKTEGHTARDGKRPKRRYFIAHDGTLWVTLGLTWFLGWKELGAMDQLEFLSILLLLMVGMLAASWVAVRCGIRAPIEKERGNGKEE